MGTAGCDNDFKGHTCTKTPEPTPVPTAAPEPVHPCTDGSHGCDKGEGGICTEDGAGWKCDCAAGYRCVMNCCPFKKNQKGHVCKKDEDGGDAARAGAGFGAIAAPASPASATAA